MKNFLTFLFLLFYLFLFGCLPDSPGKVYDTDGDEIYDEFDFCLYAIDPENKDFDGDEIGDVCDSCPFIPNPDPQDQEIWINCEDGKDNDVDGDCMGNHCDNCPYHFNPEQKDFNNDSVGDACAE